MKKIFLVYVVLNSIVFGKFSGGYDTLKSSLIESGVKYLRLADSSKPVVIDLLEIDLNNRDLNISMGISNDSLNLGGERTSSFVKRKMMQGDVIIAAINADFFGDKPMQAQNSMICDGEIIKAVNKNRNQIAFDFRNVPYISNYTFEGKLITGLDTMKIDALNSQDTNLSCVLFSSYWRGELPEDDDSRYIIINSNVHLFPDSLYSFIDYHIANIDSCTTINPDELIIKISDSTEMINSDDTLKIILSFKDTPGKIKTLVGGLPLLFLNGKLPDNYENIAGITSKKFIDQNPRTVIGYNREKTKLFIAVIDGRQPDYSMGFTLMEEAVFMKQLGCYDVLNFDGGGSSTMVIEGEVINSPSDITGERAVYNYLIIK